MSRIVTLPTRPLKPGNKLDVDINHDDQKAIQYEFYIPAAVWSHSAVQAFKAGLAARVQGATIFKTATGVWEGAEEDTNIYRMILDPKELKPKDIRTSLQDGIAEMMARLSEWTESVQQSVLFTETKIHMSLSSLVKPATATRKRRRRKNAR